MTLLFMLHGYVAYAVLGAMLALAAWSGFFFLTRRPPGAALTTVLWLAEALVVAQSVLGALLWGVGLRAPNDFHYLYGIVTPLILPAFDAAGRRTPHLRGLLLLLAALVVFGMSLRSFATAGRPLLPGL